MFSECRLMFSFNSRISFEYSVSFFSGLCLLDLLCLLYLFSFDSVHLCFLLIYWLAFLFSVCLDHVPCNIVFILRWYCVLLLFLKFSLFLFYIFLLFVLSILNFEDLIWGVLLCLHLLFNLFNVWWSVVTSCITRV